MTVQPDLLATFLHEPDPFASLMVYLDIFHSVVAYAYCPYATYHVDVVPLQHKKPLSPVYAPYELYV